MDADETARARLAERDGEAIVGYDADVGRGEVVRVVVEEERPPGGREPVAIGERAVWPACSFAP